jgi:hypothetical protein
MSTMFPADERNASSPGRLTLVRASHMPAGLIERQQHVFVRANRLSEFVEIGLHGGGRDLRQDQGEGVVCARLHGATEIGEAIALVRSVRAGACPW